MNLVFPYLLLALIGVACFAPAMMDVHYVLHRRTLVTVAAGTVLSVMGRDWWLCGLWAVMVWNLLSRPLPAMHLTRLSTIIACYAVYVTGRSHITPNAIVIVLGGLAVLAPLAYLIGLRWFQEADCMGQGNQNHADSILVLSIASALGLTWADSSWWLLALAPILGILIGPSRYKPIRMAWIWLAHVGMFGLALWAWEVALIGLAAELAWLWYIGGPLRFLPAGIDSGRVRIWWILLGGAWWTPGWSTRLFGQGWNSWASWADSFAMLEWKLSGKPLKDYKKDQYAQPQFFSHPHSEYVHILFEQGAVGLVCLIGWMISLGVHAWSTPIGQAVLFPAVAMASIALTHFPWTFPVEHSWGHMGLVTITLVLVLLLGGVP